MFGRWDETKGEDNIDFMPTILSRFDMIFIVKDEHNEERDVVRRRRAPPRPAGLSGGRVGRQGLQGSRVPATRSACQRAPKEVGCRLQKHYMGVPGPASPVHHVRFDLRSLIPWPSVLCMWNEGVDL